MFLNEATLLNNILTRYKKNKIYVSTDNWVMLEVFTLKIFNTSALAIEYWFSFPWLIPFTIAYFISIVDYLILFLSLGYLFDWEILLLYLFADAVYHSFDILFECQIFNKNSLVGPGLVFILIATN